MLIFYIKEKKVMVKLVLILVIQAIVVNYVDVLIILCFGSDNFCIVCYGLFSLILKNYLFLG